MILFNFQKTTQIKSALYVQSLKLQNSKTPKFYNSSPLHLIS